MIVYLFPNGQVERNTARRSGNRWRIAYSEVSPRGVTQQMTQREWFQVGKRDGFTCRFHNSEQEARQALDNEG